MNSRSFQPFPDSGFARALHSQLPAPPGMDREGQSCRLPRQSSLRAFWEAVLPLEAAGTAGAASLDVLELIPSIPSRELLSAGPRSSRGIPESSWTLHRRSRAFPGSVLGSGFALLQALIPPGNGFSSSRTKTQLPAPPCPSQKWEGVKGREFSPFFSR